MASFSSASNLSAKRGLFGGAIELNLRSEYADVSDVRQVPDHQEVYIHKDNEVSIIVELLQHAEEFEDTLDAVHHHYTDLLEANEALENSVMSEGVLTAENSFLPKLNDNTCKMAIIGKQTVGKFRTRPGMQVDHIYLVLVLVRLVDVGTDLLISMNIPSSALLPPKTENSEAEVGGIAEINNSILAGLEDRMNIQQLLDSAAFEPADASDPLASCFQDFRVLLSTFEIKDWSLFG